MESLAGGVTMIAIHSRILPREDDRKATIEEALAMEKAAMEEGITRISQLRIIKVVATKI